MCSKKKKKIASHKEKQVGFIQNKSTETVPAKDLVINLLDKDFRTTVLKMLKQVKEDVEKSRNQCMNIIEASKKQNRKPKGN